jgi:hypothetical protein
MRRQGCSYEWSYSSRSNSNGSGGSGFSTVRTTEHPETARAITRSAIATFTSFPPPAQKRKQRKTSLKRNFGISLAADVPMVLPSSAE